jgi:hypothetical protein
LAGTLHSDRKNIPPLTHSSARDPISGQLSQESISFSLDNSDRTWDSVNPQGIYKYIYERQPVTVRYGMDVDGKTEWVSGGMFFLSEWSVPANSIEASFQARDAFLYLSRTSIDDSVFKSCNHPTQKIFTVTGMVVRGILGTIKERSSSEHTAATISDSCVISSKHGFQYALGLRERSSFIVFIVRRVLCPAKNVIAFAIASKFMRRRQKYSFRHSAIL